MWFMNNESDFRRDANPIKHVKQDEMLHYDAKLTHFVVFFLFRYEPIE